MSAGAFNTSGPFLPPPVNGQIHGERRHGDEEDDERSQEDIRARQEGGGAVRIDDHRAWVKAL